MDPKLKCRGVYRLFFFMVMLIFLYWVLMMGLHGSHNRFSEFDPLNKIFINVPYLENCCSWWPLSHFFFFFILGLLFPECDIPVVIGGILWELFEVIVYYSIKQERQGIRRGNDKIEYSNNWWSGSTKDILMNIMGFYLGKLVIKISGKRIVIPYVNDECDNRHEKDSYHGKYN